MRSTSIAPVSALGDSWPRENCGRAFGGWCAMRKSCRRGELSPLQHVADATHGLDEARRARVVFDLLPQVADVDFDDIRLTHEVVAPDAVEDGLPVEHL